MRESETKTGQNPLISVVIPCFRAGELLAEAIESVLAQTETDWELILVDNNASDETRAVVGRYVARYPEKIRSVFESEQGNSSARNKGIKESSGKYIAFLDDDDLMYPNRLEKQLDVALRNVNCSIVYADMDLCSQSGLKLEKKFFSSDKLIYSEDILIWSPRYKQDPPLFTFPSIMFFSKERALECGMFDEKFNPFFHEDTDFCLRMWELGPFVKVCESLGMFREASADFLAMKRKGMLSLYLRERNQNQFFNKCVHKYFNPRNKINLRSFKKLQSRLLRELACHVLKFEEGKLLGRALIQRAVRASPSDWKNWKWFLRTFLPNLFLCRFLGEERLHKERLEDVLNPQELKRFFTLPTD